jgi:hypothetical protein
MTSVRFQAVVEPARGGGHVLEVDRALADEIGAKHMTRVRGTLDGTEYRSNVASMGGRLVLGVHKTTLAAARRDIGDSVEVTMSIDTEPREKDR